MRRCGCNAKTRNDIVQLVFRSLSSLYECLSVCLPVYGTRLTGFLGLNLTGLPCSLCSPGSTVTGPVAKECADLWPRIASNAPSIAWGDQSCVGMLIMHSVICNVMLKYTFTKKNSLLTYCEFQVVYLQNTTFNCPITFGEPASFAECDWTICISGQVAMGLQLSQGNGAWNEMASYKKTWFSEGVQTAYMWYTCCSWGWIVRSTCVYNIWKKRHGTKQLIPVQAVRNVQNFIDWSVG